MQRRLKESYVGSTNYYFLSLEKGCVIDSGIRGSAARFVNHSCNPNSEMQKWYVNGVPRIGLFAGPRRIQAGAELTYDYNFDWFEGAVAQFCYCKSDNCRGVIGKRVMSRPDSSQSNSSSEVANSKSVPPIKLTMKHSKNKWAVKIPVKKLSSSVLKRSKSTTTSLLSTNGSAIRAKSAAKSSPRPRTSGTVNGRVSKAGIEKVSIGPSRLNPSKEKALKEKVKERHSRLSDSSTTVEAGTPILDDSPRRVTRFLSSTGDFDLIPKLENPDRRKKRISDGHKQETQKQPVKLPEPSPISTHIVVEGDTPVKRGRGRPKGSGKLKRGRPKSAPKPLEVSTEPKAVTVNNDHHTQKVAVEINEEREVSVQNRYITIEPSPIPVPVPVNEAARVLSEISDSSITDNSSLTQKKDSAVSGGNSRGRSRRVVETPSTESDRETQTGRMSQNATTMTRHVPQQATLNDTLVSSLGPASLLVQAIPHSYNSSILSRGETTLTTPSISLRLNEFHDHGPDFAIGAFSDPVSPIQYGSTNLRVVDHSLMQPITPVLTSFIPGVVSVGSLPTPEDERPHRNYSWRRIVGIDPTPEPEVNKKSFSDGRWNNVSTSSSFLRPEPQNSPPLTDRELNWRGSTTFVQRHSSSDADVEDEANEADQRHTHPGYNAVTWVDSPNTTTVLPQNSGERTPDYLPRKRGRPRKSIPNLTGLITNGIATSTPQKSKNQPSAVTHSGPNRTLQKIRENSHVKKDVRSPAPRPILPKTYSISKKPSPIEIKNSHGAEGINNQPSISSSSQTKSLVIKISKRSGTTIHRSVNDALNGVVDASRTITADQRPKELITKNLEYDGFSTSQRRRRGRPRMRPKGYWENKRKVEREIRKKLPSRPKGRPPKSRETGELIIVEDF